MKCDQSQDQYFTSFDIFWFSMSFFTFNDAQRFFSSMQHCNSPSNISETTRIYAIEVMGTIREFYETTSQYKYGYHKLIVFSEEFTYTRKWLEEQYRSYGDTAKLSYGKFDAMLKEKTGDDSNMKWVFHYDSRYWCCHHTIKGQWLSECQLDTGHWPLSLCQWIQCHTDAAVFTFVHYIMYLELTLKQVLWCYAPTNPEVVRSTRSSCT